MSYGDPTDASNLMGPLVSKKQQERVLGYIEKGKEEGARVVTRRRRAGAPADTGYYVEPTLFADVDNSMTIAQEEIFGPVLVVIGYEDDDDAVRIANDSPYGLSGHDHLGRPRAGQGRRPPGPHRHARPQRRHLVRRRRPVRRLQAVRHRPPVRHRGPRDVHADQDGRLARTDAGPLDGIRIIEVASWMFVPSGGSVLVDWGADVIKVEPIERRRPAARPRHVGAPPGRRRRA